MDIINLKNTILDSCIYLILLKKQNLISNKMLFSKIKSIKNKKTYKTHHSTISKKWYDNITIEEVIYNDFYELSKIYNFTIDDVKLAIKSLYINESPQFKKEKFVEFYNYYFSKIIDELRYYNELPLFTHELENEQILFIENYNNSEHRKQYCCIEHCGTIEEYSKDYKLQSLLNSIEKAQENISKLWK